MSETVELAGQASGTGPALVMLHGLYGSGNNWRGIARQFEKSHRTLLPDLRNHGHSPTHPDMDYRRMAADVLALLDREGIDQASLVGHSMGGKVAMALALTAPQRVERLLVVDIAPMAYDHSAEHGRIIQAMREVNLGALRSREDADSALSESIPHAAVRQFLLTNLQREGGHWQWRIPLDILADQLPVIQGWPSGLGTFSDAPVEFIHGGASGYVDDRGRAAIAGHFPDATVLSYAGVGHWIHAEDPKRFSTDLHTFLSDNNNP